VRKILLIGSAHIDVLATFGEESRQHLDKTGRLQLAVGGTAFNIAVNLAQHRREVALMTVLKMNSVFTQLITERLRETHVNGSFIVESENLSESGFIAHLCCGQIVSAVTCAPVETYRFSTNDLGRAMAWADIVAVDTNLSLASITAIVEVNKQKYRPLYAACVSESKITRIYKQFHKATFEFVLLNEREAARIGYETSGLIKNDTVRSQICADLAAKAVVLTRGDEGFDVIRAGEQVFHIPAVRRCLPLSELGAGDALCAGLLSLAPEIDWLNCASVVDEYVMPVLMSNTATANTDIID